MLKVSSAKLKKARPRHCLGDIALRPQCAACAGAGRALWVEKHAPRSAADLTVHAKKVAEVRTWLQLQLLPAQGPTARAGAPRVCVMSGQSSHHAAAWCAAAAH